MTQNYFEPPVVVKIYKTYQVASPLLLNFPKPYRYSLGQTLDRALLNMLELIFEANSLPRLLWETPLLKAQAKCELSKILLRLAAELKLIKETQYFQLIANLQEVGKMLHGWINYVRKQPTRNNLD